MTAGTRAPAEQGKLVILASGPDFDAIEGGPLDLPFMEGVAARLRAAEAQGHGDKDMAATYLADPPTPPNVKPAQAR